MDTKTLSDKLENVDTDKYSKARKLVENNHIQIKRAHQDRVIFQVKGENGEYELGLDPKTNNSLCQCKAEHFNNHCYHKIAATIMLTKPYQ